MIKLFKEWWGNQPSDKRVSYKKFSTIALMIFVAWLAYVLKSSSKDESDSSVVHDEIEVINSDKIFEEDFREEARKKEEEVDEVLKEQEKEITALRELLQAMKESDVEKSRPDTAPVAADKEAPSWPQAPGNVPYIRNSNDQLQQSDPVSSIPAEPVITGGIRRIKGVEKKDDSEKKKGGSNRFYLAPGFMKARLLEGVEVSATQNAEENPPALLFRVQKPAVLPNNVKANLKGCFVIANAYGKLNKERIDFRTVSLHCISHKDKTLIDTEIRGHVDDSDGKLGLAARVVTRVGANIGRAFASGVISGLGEGYSKSISHGINAVGGTIVTEPLSDEQIVKTGIGSGLSRGARILEEYYLEIIRQTSPTLESGSGRDVTIVLTEGIWLELKDIHAQGGIQ